MAEESRVVVSIKPLHSLVSAVMNGDTEPELLVKGNSSPHNFTLRPSQMSALTQADLVFYIGDMFELFLRRIMTNLPATTERITMATTPGLVLLPIRTPGATMPDLHYWLMPQNAIAMVRHIDEVLSRRYPKKQALYHHNALALEKRLQALDSELHNRMEKLRGIAFIVFHDATQYYEHAYGLKALTALTLYPDRMMSAGHIAEVSALIKAQHISCIFREPMIDAGLVKNIAGETGINSAELDPEALRQTPGKELYFQLMESLASSMEECLAKREKKNVKSG